MVVASAADVLFWLVWVVAAFCVLASGLAVVSFRNPFHSALSLIANLASLAVIFLLAHAEFVAAAQVLVYAGAVMVMFLFVIAYLGREADAPYAGGPSWRLVAAVTAAAALLVEVIVAVGLATGGRLSSSEEIRAGFGSPALVGRLFLTDHLLAFEITSIVLLVAAVGGVILGSHSRQALDADGPGLGEGPAAGEGDGGSVRLADEVAGGAGLGR